MFLARGDTDLGVAFQTQPGSQASSRVETNTSILLCSTDGYLLEPTEWPKGTTPPVEFGERNRDCALGHGGNEGPHFGMTGCLGVFLERRPQCGVSHEVRRQAQ